MSSSDSEIDSGSADRYVICVCAYECMCVARVSQEEYEQECLQN
jgi:hypothetical protein